MRVRTWQQLEALIESFDGSPADLERIAQSPVTSAAMLQRLFEGIETEAEAAALVRANPRWAAELATGQDAYNQMVAAGRRFSAIRDAADPAPLIAALSPKDRADFVRHMMTFPADGTEHEAGAAYAAMVITE